MTPEQFNIIITTLQGISSSIELVAEVLTVLIVVHIVGGFVGWGK